MIVRIMENTIEGKIISKELGVFGSPQIIEGYGFEQCDLIPSDLLDAEITWQGKNVAALRGTPVQVRFYLRNVGLYAIQCTDDKP